MPISGIRSRVQIDADGGVDLGVSGVSEGVGLQLGVPAFDDWLLNYSAVGTADQTYTDTQTIDTLAEGAVAGVWEADADTSCQVLSNELVAGLNDGLFHQAGITTANGVGNIAIWKIDTGTSSSLIGGYSTSAAVSGDTQPGFVLSSPNFIRVTFGNAFADVSISITNDTIYHIALVRGGYSAETSTSDPFEDGDTESSYDDGGALLIKGGVFTNWTLLGKTASAAPIGYLQYQVTATDPSLLWLRVPDNVSGLPLVAPTIADRFGTNGSLDASPEATWTERSGNWDISGGVASCNGAGIATITGSADGVIEGSLNGGTDDDPGLVFRYSDANNYWYAQVDVTNNLLEIHKVDGGTDTVEASSAFTFSASTDYRICVTLEGDRIYAYVDFGNNSDAAVTDSHNSTATEHGLIAGTANSSWTNFAYTPRTGFTDLDTYI